MSLRILWIEDDNLPAVREAITDEGYTLTVAESLHQAEELVTKNRYDLVVLDVMMAISPEDTAIGYTYEEVEGGSTAGLAFYRRNRQRLEKTGAEVVVLTILGDNAKLKDRFLAAGLDKDAFWNKVTDSNISLLLQHIEDVFRRSGRLSGSKPL